VKCHQNMGGDRDGDRMRARAGVRLFCSKDPSLVPVRSLGTKEEGLLCLVISLGWT
jgi:hypothetical protein